jgi:hypothetical protein
MTERNAAVPADRRIEWRIGINVGDIVVEDGDILVMASTLLPGSNPWPNQVGSASPRACSRMPRVSSTLLS